MNKGFTLIELLVSIAIFSILSTFVVANYRSNEDVKRLKNQAELLVDGLEAAQNKAMTGALADNSTPLAYKLKVSPCDNNCNYAIYAVLAGSEEGSLIERKNLTNVQIITDSNSDLTAEFGLPRGRLSLGEGKPSAWAQLSNGDNYFCVGLAAVSGRIDLKSGRCP